MHACDGAMKSSNPAKRIPADILDILLVNSRITSLVRDVIAISFLTPQHDPDYCGPVCHSFFSTETA